MARTQRVSKYVALNREAVDALRLGWADGAHEAANLLQARVRPPDAAPYGKGLVQSGGVITYVEGKVVARTGTGSVPRGAQPKSLGTVFGWKFPARFQELGTSRQPARPFATPAWASGLGEAGEAVTEGMRQRLARVRS